MLTITQLNNLRDISKHALECEQATGVPCELTISQWAQESGWGQHSPGNNCFGIKEYPGCFGRQLLYTTEFFTPTECENWLKAKEGRKATIENATPTQNGRLRYQVQDWFATFATIADCFKKRAELFSKPIYKPFLDQYVQDKNVVSFVQGMSKRYSTDPEYPKYIFQIASIREVQDAIKEAKITPL